jgi:hypothetical protein
MKFKRKHGEFEEGCELTVAYPVIFSGGLQQIQLWTEGRENEDLGAVAP